VVEIRALFIKQLTCKDFELQLHSDVSCFVSCKEIIIGGVMDYIMTKLEHKSFFNSA
jgi:hypothetical protein